MTRRRKSRPTTYQVWLDPRVHAERRELPGNVRQRMRQAMVDLASDPRPRGSQTLDLSKLGPRVTVPAGIEFRRLRLDPWRIVYAVDEAWQAVIVLAIRRRPPYDYEDLDDLVAGLEE